MGSESRISLRRISNHGFVFKFHILMYACSDYMFILACLHDLHMKLNTVFRLSAVVFRDQNTIGW